MKKLMVTLSIIALAVMQSNAQVAFGVKAGLNLSTFIGADAKNIPGKALQAGLNTGAIVSIPVSRNFSIQSEAVFSMQGVKFTGGADKLNYLNVPVLAHVASSKGLFIEAGPQIGFLLSAKEKATGQADDDIKEFIQPVDFSLVYGMGYLTHAGVGFNARANFGLSTIDKNSGGGTKSKIDNYVIQVGVFYMFAGKKGRR